MGFQDFAVSFTVDQTPEEVFAAINNVRGWWSGPTEGSDIEGNTDSVGDVWSYRYKDVHYSKQRITELVPGQRVAWHVEDGYLNFTRDTTEWTGTDITFDILESDGTTEVRFAHVGLTPDVECFDNCSSAWTYYVKQCLPELIAQSTLTRVPEPAPSAQKQ
jgi:hypothetical protein